MMKATGLKRGSRKKQQQQQAPPPPQPPAPAQPDRSNSRDERPPVMMQQQVRPAPEQYQQQKQQQQHHQLQQPQYPKQLHPEHNPKLMRRTSTGSHRREPTPEQMELTKKNYRLAKELSELRVRNREECKNVARLTMENMNLASRCREAISHVAMLKKELAMHQKQAQDAIKFQREQTQRMASNLSSEVSRLNRSYSNDSESVTTNSSPDRKAEMERVLSSIQPPPPPPPRKSGSSMLTRPSSKEDPPKEDKKAESVIRTVSPRGEVPTDAEYSSSNGDEDDTVEETQRGRSVLDVVESLSDLSSPDKLTQLESRPRMYSTPNRNRKEDRWTPNIGAAPGCVGKDTGGMSLFPHSASPKVVGHSRHRSYNEEFPEDIKPIQSHRGSHASSHSDEEEEDDDEDSAPPHMSLLDRHSGMITMNSIDAFEASFDTTFPSTFARRDGGIPKGSRPSPQTDGIYNPFAPSPARSEKSAPSPPRRGESSIISASESPTVVRKAHVSDGSPFSPRQTGDAGHSANEDAQYETPRKERKSPEKTPYGEPSRPHKTASAEARRRYEKALQPRGGANANKRGSEASVSTTNAVAPVKSEETKGAFSPSRLLQRIQHRRKPKDDGKDKQDAPQTSPPATIEMEFSGQYSPSESSLTENVAPSEGIRMPSPREPMEPRGLTPREMSARSPSRSSTEPVDEEYQEQPPDAPAGRPGGMIARLNSLKQTTRRSVKQPISYAEPSLNTKIRQGHNFFPKQTQQQEEQYPANGEPQIVTPEPAPTATSAAM